MPPLSRQNARFLMGALAHGMEFDQALPLFQEFAAQRQANQERRREEEKELESMTGQLAYQAGEWLMSGQDPELVRSTVEAMASANNLGAGEVSRLSDLLGGIEGGSTGPDAAAREAFSTTVAPFLGGLAETDDFKGDDGLPNRAKLRHAARLQFPHFADDPDFDTLIDEWYGGTAVPADRYADYQAKLAGEPMPEPSLRETVENIAGLGMLGAGGAVGYDAALGTARKGLGRFASGSKAHLAANRMPHLLMGHNSKLSSLLGKQKPPALPSVAGASPPGTSLALRGGGSALSGLRGLAGVRGMAAPAIGGAIGRTIGDALPDLPEWAQAGQYTPESGFGPDDGDLSIPDRAYGTLRGISKFLTPGDGSWWS